MNETTRSLAAGLLALAATAATARAQDGTDPLLPPNAKPGECYARVFAPATYETKTKKVLKSDAIEQVEVIPAKYETVEEPVLVKEATTELELIPTRYETVEEQILVKPAEKRLEVVPAEFDTAEEKVLVKAGYTTWKLGRGPIEKLDAGTGEIMCLVEVPPEYKTVTKTILKKPASVREVEVPAQYVTVKKQVVAEPAKAVQKEVAAVYRTVQVQRLVEPAREVKKQLPAEYVDVTETVKTADGDLEWRPILCETNTTPDIVRRIQVALRSAGYDPGPLDGALGGKTVDALKAFQQSKGLASGQLTMETLDKLGVKTTSASL